MEDSLYKQLVGLLDITAISSGPGLIHVIHRALVQPMSIVLCLSEIKLKMNSMII